MLKKIKLTFLVSLISCMGIAQDFDMGINPNNYKHPNKAKLARNPYAGTSPVRDTTTNNYKQPQNKMAEDVLVIRTRKLKIAPTILNYKRPHGM